MAMPEIASTKAQTALLRFFQEFVGTTPRIFGVQTGKLDEPDNTRPADPYTYVLVTFNLDPQTREYWERVEVYLRTLDSATLWEPVWLRVYKDGQHSVYHFSGPWNGPYQISWGSGPWVTKETRRSGTTSR